MSVVTGEWPLLSEGIPGTWAGVAAYRCVSTTEMRSLTTRGVRCLESQVVFELATKAVAEVCSVCSIGRGACVDHRKWFNHVHVL